MGDDGHIAEAQLFPAHAQLTHNGVRCCIAALSIDDAVPLFYGWAEREGWNPAVIDPRLWATVDSCGFHALYRVATAAEDEAAAATAALEPICILGTLIIDDENAFLGPFISAGAYQRRGFGSLLFDHGMARLAPTQRRIGLDSTLEQRPSYARRGFEHTAAEEWRYTGIVARSDGDEPMTDETGATLEVVPALTPRIPFERVYALYEQCSESNLFTRKFCRTLLSSPGCVSLAALSSASTDSSRQPQRVVGLIVARRAGRGYRVAPLFAHSPQVAVSLLQRLQQQLGSGTEDESGMHIDVPSSHTAAVQLVEKLSLRKVFASVRCFTRPPRSVPHHFVYGSEPCP